MELFKKRMKCTWILCITFLFVVTACTNVETSAPASSSTTPDSNAAPTQSEETTKPQTLFDMEQYQDNLTVRFFYLEGNERKGDCILIRTPDGKRMMIDAGRPEVGGQIVKYLDNLGIDTIDIALNTHPHIDHIGGFATVAKEKKIKQFYLSDIPAPQYKSYNNAMQALKDTNTPIEHLKDGDTFYLGEDVKFEVLNPPKAIPAEITKDFKDTEFNNNSIVLRMTYKDNVFLFTGDIYDEQELKLVKSKGKLLDADFVDAPHHGFHSSSSIPFIKAVTPQIVVASCNNYSQFDVLQPYKEYGGAKEAISTGTAGNILITSDGKNLNMITKQAW